MAKPNKIVGHLTGFRSFRNAKLNFDNNWTRFASDSWVINSGDFYAMESGDTN